jgi:hypothetical protein
MIMTALLTGLLEIKTERPVLGEAIWVRMTITNGSDQEFVIVNPDVGVPPPDLDWRASDQAYQIALLMSFGLLKITLKDTDEELVESKGLMSWVTPILGKRTLHPHDNLVLDFDLNELFLIDSAGLYSVWLRYGDNEVYAEASMDIEIMPHAIV